MNENLQILLGQSFFLHIFTFKSASVPDPADFTAGPQAPDQSGLLDGIEEQFKVRLVTMDVDGETPMPDKLSVSFSSFGINVDIIQFSRKM